MVKKFKYKVNPYYLAAISGIGGLVGVTCTKLLAELCGIQMYWHVLIPAVVLTMLRPLYSPEWSRLRTCTITIGLSIMSGMIVLMAHRLL